MVSLNNLQEKSAVKSGVEEILHGLASYLGTCSNPLYLSFETVSLLKIKTKKKKMFYLTVLKLKPSVGRKFGVLWRFVCFESPETVWF